MFKDLGGVETKFLICGGGTE